MRVSRCGLVVLALCALVVPLAAVAEPIQLAAQGRLTTVAGSAVPDGNYALAVLLYDVPSGGTPVWNESFLAAAVQGGVFALNLGGALSKLDSGLFAAGKPLYVALTVGADPELPRQPLQRVPFAVQALIAASANDLQCSGCVGSDDLAKASVTGEKIATGAVGANHVSFNWAAADAPGGIANFAAGANNAKQAENAKNAELAAFAEEANSAKLAEKAKAVQCTGCLTAPMLADAVAADLVAAGKLAKVATSGKYADLAGGPDLSGYGALAGANTWTKTNTLTGGATMGAALNFASNEAKLMRLQNADADPAPCDSAALGMIYYNTAQNALMVCNGKAFISFAYGIPIGSDAKSPGLSCQHIFDKTGTKKDGQYWIDPNGGNNNDAFLAYCDMTKDGGGWTRVMTAKYKFFFGDGNWNNYNAGAPADPNYSILNLRDNFKVNGTYTLRYQTGVSGDWQSGPVGHFTTWQQNHDPFTATTDGSDFKQLGGELSTTCGSFNGLHNKYTTYSYTCDPDVNDSVGCWWMQAVPKQDYDGKGYLEGYGGSGHYHNWQALWLR